MRLTKGTASGTILSDPKFTSYLANDAGNYRVLSGSSAIDRGTSTNAPNTDIALVARPRGTAFDIGAYESERTQALDRCTAPRPRRRLSAGSA